MKFPRVILNPKQRNNILGALLIIVFLSLFGSLRSTLWPGGWGIEKGKSVTTETVQSDQTDKLGKPVKTTRTTTFDDGKTFWDWMSLLGVPLTLAILGVLFQQIQLKQAEAAAREQRELASEEAKEEILQGYFDRLSVLLVDKNLLAISAKVRDTKSSGEGESQQLPDGIREEQELLDSSLDVIRARTLSILRRFEDDSVRKGSVMRFLIEAHIISRLELNLSSSELSQANLQGAKLYGANLEGANLQGANLQGALEITPAQVKAALNWQIATYSDPFRQKLGLPKAKNPPSS